MKVLTPKQIAYIASICLLIILVTQAYLVYDYFQTTRAGLVRESDAIIQEVFKKDLNMRSQFHRNSKKNDNSISVIKPSSNKQSDKQIVATYNFDKMKVNKEDYMNLIDIAINEYTSKKFPIKIENIDSITKQILNTRGIFSDYNIKLINRTSGKIIQQSRTNFSSSLFVVSSEYLQTDFANNKSLQLVLINPFGIIIKRMGLLLLSSLILSIICMLAFRELFRTLARQKKLMEVKNDFFGHTAHELKRPVAQLHLALEALSKPTINDDVAKKERYLAISKEASRDMSEKITMIMTLSMAEEGVFRLNYSKFNLLEEVQKLKEQFSTVADKEVSIQIENIPDDYQINADKDHLRQCVANLLDNAIKYSGGSVLISITLKKLKDSLCVSVKDNGIGIKADKLDKVFDKYTRLNTKAGSPTGFGIGLSYVKAVVEKHAGRIELKSEETKGSEFILYLPA